MLMAEFVTAVKYQLPIKVVVIKNNTLGQIKWEQMVFLGNPEYGCDLSPIDFAAFARACGGTGFTIEDPADCGRLMEQALSMPGPVLVEAVVDPFEPPMPPKVTLDQTTKFAESLVRGEPCREQIAVTAGSRGIANLALILKTAVDAVRARGGESFIVPAMGSHGGATDEGQLQLLRGALGITPETMGCPVRSSMKVVELGRTTKH